MSRKLFVVLTGWLTASPVLAAEPSWQPVAGVMTTRWSKDVSPRNALPDYPRPQMVRDEWLNLNGLWQLVVEGDKEGASNRQRQILVPFPVESALSGIGEHHERIRYRRGFDIPSAWKGRRVRLHFGAVDWESVVRVNGKEVGQHQGGYDPFSFDITDALRAENPQQIEVDVADPTDAGSQPHGKQHLKPEGIWYTPTTGIWQTVWVEPVGRHSIERLKMDPDVEQRRLRLTAYTLNPQPGQTIEAIVLEQNREVVRAQGTPGGAIELSIPDPQLWSPQRPFLYDVRVTLSGAGEVLDEVRSYFGMRKIEVKPIDGITRILLNGEALFELGPLDQGFWPDGLYTAPSDEALRYDIEMMKRLGYNLARKHVKVEPERWYYWCDKLGLLVWQDMPHAHHAQRDSKQFQRELGRMIEALANHPAIVMWVVFNEGWGQHRTEWFTSLVKQLDPTRLVSNASGWTDKRVGDIIDIHVYPGPRAPKPEPKRAAVLGEFGGLGLAVKGHVWTEKNWSYRGTEGSEALTYAYVNLLRRVWQLRDDPGLSAAVYTQLTDVEGEINGLLTYDRAVVKVDISKIALANAGRFPREQVILPTAQKEGAPWKYTFQKPPDEWFATNFDDAAWRQGAGGFGTEGTPGGNVRTNWNTEEIWLRRSVELPEFHAEQAALLLHHDEDAEVYFNGIPAASVSGYTTDYEWVPLSEEARAALHPGRNLIAVHCKQTGGGQYVDVGLVELDWQ